MNEGDKMYMVLKLNRTITVNLDGTERQVNIGGAAGYIPVYHDYDTAKEVAGDNYQIFEVQISNEE